MSLTQVYGADTSARLALAIIIALPAATPKEFKNSAGYAFGNFDNCMCPTDFACTMLKFP